MFGFGKALDVLRDGDAVTRRGWQHPEAIFVRPPRLKLDRSSRIEATEPEEKTVIFPEVLTVETSGLDEDWIRPWFPTHEDLLAEDWDYVRDDDRQPRRCDCGVLITIPPTGESVVCGCGKVHHA
jgi:hypothetical protein